MRAERPVHLYWVNVPDDPAKIGLSLRPKLIWLEHSSRTTKASNLVKQKCGWLNAMCV
jgi:hypothetical protein